MVMRIVRVIRLNIYIQSYNHLTGKNRGKGRQPKGQRSPASEPGHKSKKNHLTTLGILILMLFVETIESAQVKASQQI
jgi:hypothetical protein